MVSAAAGSMALVAAPLVRDHGFQYLILATVLAGLFQIGLARAGVASLLSMLPRGVTIGFVNGLAILIFLAQLPHIVSPLVFWLVLGGLAIVFGARALSVRIPPSLISTAVLTIVAVSLSLDVPTVGDEGALPTSLPAFASPDLPVAWHTLAIVLPTALSLAAVGLVESLLTADLLDRITQTSSSKRREAYGQGIANVVTGFFGGQPGCAMIGQSLLNVDSGGRGRLSTFAAGAWLLALVVLARPLMEILPMAALVATMIGVALTTFDWQSIMPARLRGWPIAETAVMVITTVVVVATSNLAYGVVAGGVAACALFIRDVAASVQVRVETTQDGAARLHDVHGALFFASTGRLIDQLQTEIGDARVVRIDLSRSHVWDATAALALEELVAHYRERGVTVELEGANPASAALRERLLA
jgi:SulP family sulfate permease